MIFHSLVLSMRYYRYILGRPLASIACTFEFQVDTATILVDMNMLLQMAVVKFLYTNVWCNVGSRTDEFWSLFISLLNTLTAVYLFLIIPFVGYVRADEMSICLGVPPNCQENFLSPYIFPNWVNPNTYTLMVIISICILTWRSQKTKNRLNDLFLRRFGNNSRFGQTHVGLSGDKVTLVVFLLGFAFVILLEFYGQMFFSANDYKSMPGSTFHVLRELTLCSFAYIIGPLAYILQNKKQKNGLQRSISKLVLKKMIKRRVTPIIAAE